MQCKVLNKTSFEDRLHKMGDVQSPLCSLCKQEKETVNICLAVGDMIKLLSLEQVVANLVKYYFEIEVECILFTVIKTLTILLTI